MEFNGETPLPLSKYSKRVLVKTILESQNGGSGLIGQKVIVGGLVKSSREFRKEVVAVAPPVPAPAPDAGEFKDGLKKDIQNKLYFLKSMMKAWGGDHRVREKKVYSISHKAPLSQPSVSILRISDGSAVSSLQVIVDSILASPAQVMPTGTSILVEGILQKPSLQGKETIEVKAERILHLCTADQERYPLSRKRLPLESLRDFAYFRPRTTTVASVMRMRSALTEATHAFFRENGFLHVQIPIITGTDCEGYGDIFQVTSLLGESKVEFKGRKADLGRVKASIHEKGRKIDELKRSESNREALAAAVQDLRKTNDLASLMEAEDRKNSENSYTHLRDADFSQDFFSCRAFLSVSGMLHLGSYASAFGNVYSFGPRFRRNKSESKKLLAEMWMAELVMAFSELEDSMECAKDFLKFICKWTLENCKEDLRFLSKRVDNQIAARLHSIINGTFEKVSYIEAVEAFKKHLTEKGEESRFDRVTHLNDELERYIADEVYKKPIIIYNYPKEMKPFYVSSNEDGKTAAAFNMIIPKVGTLIKGSRIEERFDSLSARIKELGLERQQYEWYLDLHRNGAVKSSGFSFSFDLFVLYATGLSDLRDAVPFPRSFGKLIS